ncbi:hypothetical protein BDV98DRAFT_635747 [Pterulicium gracile]|uniref:Uncharacterized protein n=1 Tax=Pterulicium gracile TaxID=1884261 RepID=A0A5C3QDT8_9AGAR|nr:hypothetical protein BDV98DRAFT_635747 [Pterula gracilis]
MSQHFIKDSPPFPNTSLLSLGQDRTNLGPGSSPLSPFTDHEEQCPATPCSTTCSSSNGSIADSDLHLPTPDFPANTLPDVQMSAGHFDRPLMGIEAELITPTAAPPEKEGTGDTITIGQSPRPFHASNALGLMLASNAGVDDPPACDEPDQDPAPTPVPRPFAEFLQSLNGHQLIVEADPDFMPGRGALRLTLGPFVVSVLPIAPQ